MAGLKPGSVLRYLNSFKAMMNHAHERGWLEHRLKVPMPSVDDARDEHFDAKEANEFLTWVRAKRPEHEVAFTLLIDTGLRLGEALRITWRDVKLEEGFIAVRKMTHSKTRQREVPLSEALRHLLVEKKREGVKGSDYLVISKKGQPWKDANSASAGLGIALKEGCRAMGLEPLRVHDLRHTFAFLAAKNGADLGDLQQMLGHERLDMTLRYRGFMPNRSRSIIMNLRGVKR